LKEEKKREGNREAGQSLVARPLNVLFRKGRKGGKRGEGDRKGVQAWAHLFQVSKRQSGEKKKKGSEEGKESRTKAFC